jgi:hypothetical protein
MPNDMIRYDLLVQEALCGVVKKVLSEAARDGLPGDHHFYITFRTQAPGVRLSNRMREQYPEEMTIILQHQFEDLSVTDHAFEVGLSFRGIPEMLLIPFDALTGFFDPSVQFGLKFELHPEGVEEGANDTGVPPAAAGTAAAKAIGLLASPAALPAIGGGTPSKMKAGTEAVTASAEQDGTDGASEAKVVSIDAFRKKT